MHLIISSLYNSINKIVGQSSYSSLKILASDHDRSWIQFIIL